ncbi:Sensor_kinase_SpoOB-type, alpha-helical domain [Paenibacillus catalpae]|uniref:Sensor_kinase_SpoOB-type, alpha-helical domain n=1 Tax=Paenibacillus catalpae TaxID=1045775 RepID=A0A1I1Z1X1_9BACL|nr:GHKL domain-containing protein [Paenibacillus catalpae]SFE25719.1 Sensor_kinase_SpoOB-type, alpha-helical domain [Paenibacillus catalpae]
MNPRRQLIFLITSFIILGVLTCAKLVLSYYSTEKATQTTLAKQYIAIAEHIADGLDMKSYEHFLITKQRDQGSRSIEHELEQYRSRINALYVYTLLLDDTNVAKVMLSALPSTAEAIPIGFPCTVPHKQVQQAKEGRVYYTGVIKDAIHGVYLSVGVPLYNDSGKQLGVLAIDIEASQLESISEEVINSNKIIFAIDILFAVLLLLAFFVLRKWHKNTVKQDLHESELMYMSEMGKVMNSIKSSRHDLMNHFQVLHGLLTLKKYDRAEDYLKQLAADSRALDLSLRINNPVVLILFQSKWELAQSKGIELHFDTDPEEYRRIESMDLVKILSNLLDNAIEATEDYEGKLPRKIRVAAKTVSSQYVFTVDNPAMLTSKQQKCLFHKDGYTSKDNSNALHGHGLMIIRRTVNKYHGTIQFKYENEEVSIQITL